MTQIKNHDDGRQPFPGFSGKFPDFIVPISRFFGFSTMHSQLCTPVVALSQSQSKRFGKAGFDLLRAISTKKLSQFKVIQPNSTLKKDK
jgi:hypothetical protein